MKSTQFKEINKTQSTQRKPQTSQKWQTIKQIFKKTKLKLLIQQNAKKSKISNENKEVNNIQRNHKTPKKPTISNEIYKNKEINKTQRIQQSSKKYTKTKKSTKFKDIRNVWKTLQNYQNTTSWEISMYVFLLLVL